MSDANLALVSASFAAFARGDIPVVLAGFDPAIEWHRPATLPRSRGDYFGYAGVQEYFDNFAAHVEWRAMALSARKRPAAASRAESR